MSHYCPHCDQPMEWFADLDEKWEVNAHLAGKWSCQNLFCKPPATEPCEACHGTGVEHIENDVMIDEPCPECGGEGTQETE